MDSVTPDGPRRAPIRWHVATVRDARAESPTARTLVLDVPAWPGHRAGHHVDVRLTVEDGYQASRSYSIASAPDEPMVELTVERLEDGEVFRTSAGDSVTGRINSGLLTLWRCSLTATPRFPTHASSGMQGRIVATNLLTGNTRTPNYLGIPTAVLPRHRWWQWV